MNEKTTGKSIYLQELDKDFIVVDTRTNRKYLYYNNNKAIFLFDLVDDSGESDLTVSEDEFDKYFMIVE